MKNTKTLLGALALAVLLVGCGDDTEVKTKEYYDAHIEEGSKMHKNCENASKGLEEYRFNERKKYFTGGQK